MKALASPGFGQMRIPDILETIADLSNDEVFTPPELANKVLDMLPESIWSDSSITFLDPATKTGIFLREITKRLIAGLEKEIPDLQERVNHILTKQVYELGITELTTLMSRRTLYCSTTANGPQSVCTEFESTEGNIRFPASQHSFDKKGKCSVCGAGKDLYYEKEGLDNYAYSFLHDNLKEVFGDVKFDVIIGNPPYQLNVGNEGGNASRAQSLYNRFIDKAVEFNPKYISMITPSRWMTNSAEGISEEWIKKIISSNKIKYMYDYENGDHLFRNVGISGGISYFMWERDYNGPCRYSYFKGDGEMSYGKFLLNELGLNIVLRDPNSHSIVKKIEKIEKDYYKNGNNMMSIVSSKSPHNNNDEIFTSGWRGYSKQKTNNEKTKYYVSESTNNISFGYINEDLIKKNPDYVHKNKVIIPAANGIPKQILGVPRFSEKGSICSQTYLVIGVELGLTKEECINIMKYISTKFFRYLVGIKKKTQNGPKSMYQLVPIQDWKEEWTDNKLYKKYNLSKKEIEVIESSIKELDIASSLKEAERN